MSDVFIRKGDEFPTVKVAAVHSSSVYLDREGTTNKACSLIKEAGEKSAKLIAFPETYIPGYPFWIWTHTPKTGAHLYELLFRNSVTIPSETTGRIGEAARKAGAYVVMGINEREYGTLYNTLLFFDDSGEIIGKHRKLQPTNVERIIWGRGDGSDLDVYETPFGNLSGLICWEHSMDLVRYSLAALGEQIHIASWPAISALKHDPQSEIFNSWTEAAARHHAAANQTFVINVQSIIDQETIDILGLTNQPDMIQTGGGWSAIIDSRGQYISGPVTDDEQILYGDLDLSQIILSKFAADSVVHYARPDVARLVLNRSKQSIIEHVKPITTKENTNGNQEESKKVLIK